MKIYLEKMRNTKIKESSAICTSCGHSHDVEVIKNKYESFQRGRTSFYCESCNTYNRIISTKTGIFRLGSLKPKGKGPVTVREDRMNCPHCDRSIDREDFDFLLKNRTYRRTTCQSCYGPVLIRRTVLGFYTTAKADIRRKAINTEKGINRLEFDPETKTFKTIKDRYYLHKMWKQIKQKENENNNKISN